MKAIRLHKQGGPEQLVFEDAPLPDPKADEALVRVHAAAITPMELTWPATYRYPDGRERLPSIPAHEVSGVVESLGPGASEVGIGEAVYGLIDFPHDGCAAEYAAVRAGDLAPKPRTIDHVHAAAVPLSALTAWQALFDHAKIRSGQHVLIHGAAGGVGSYAVQLARWKGAHVVATASARHAALLHELGVERLVDYATTPFEHAVKNVDAVFDTVGGDTPERSWRVLKPGGVLVSIVPNPSHERARAQGIRCVFFIVNPNRRQLSRITELIDAGHVRPIVGAVLPLAQAREAFERGLAGHNRGKFVLRVADG
ncbi:MAG TPA: NADP-dependent oxidoreductase [Verrucomicrobiae bacterium]|nr:NADP-dependent oxidoreductase [Verrucomicrobiae bacterium]